MSHERVRRPIKRAAYSCIGTLIVLLLFFCPGLPWSAQYRHKLKRALVRMEMRVSAWHGEAPKLVSLSGRIVLERPRKEPLKGAQIEALDSTSGWASLTDELGQFVLRDVTWYPHAAYTLIVVANDYEARQIHFNAPGAYPEGRIINLGDLDFYRGCKVATEGFPGRNSVSEVEYDRENAEFYKQILVQLTQAGQTDEEKLDAINRYVATKLDIRRTDDRNESPRQIIERGTAYCGHLALALGTLTEAAGYRTRLIDLIDDGSKPSAHMVAEVYFGDRWHMYDPTAGAASKDERGRIASYKGLRLDPRLADYVLPAHLPAMLSEPDTRSPGLFRSGFHHYYHFRGNR